MPVVNPPFLDRTSIEPQELFDWAVRALHAMPHRAVDPRGILCRYRTGDPECPACVAGQLLTDDEIHISPEKQARNFPELSDGDDYYPLDGIATLDRLDDPGFDNLIALDLVPTRLAPHKDLIQDLQYIHDPEQNWFEGRTKMAQQLHSLAIKHKLSAAVVDELWPR